MTRKKNVFWTIYALVCGAFGIVSLYSVTIAEEYHNWLGYLAPVLSVIAIMFGSLYIIKGYGKEDSKLYKAFLLTYEISLLYQAMNCCLIYHLHPYVAMGGVLNAASAFVIVTLLCFAKNLGAKASLILARYSLIMNYGFAIVTVIVCSGILRGGDVATFAFNISNARQVILATMLYVAVRSKYVDKTERGTK